MKCILRELEDITEYMDMLAEMKKQNLPLVLWGIGDMASEVYNYISGEGIEIVAVCIDDDYYEEGLEFVGYNVEKFSDYDSRYLEYNVIVGHSYYEKIEDFKREHKSVKNVYALFSVSYGVHKRTNIEYVERNIEEYNYAYSLLADDLSKDCFVQLLKTRISGNYQFILESFSGYMNYYNNSVFRVDRDEVYIDIGAYDGDTIKQFLKESDKNYRYIYALEPDDDNRHKLACFVEEEGLENVIVSPLGAWNTKSTLNFASVSTQESSVGLDISDGISIEVDRVDSMFEYRLPPTLIKINYFHGVEEAIEGCSRLLIDYNPKIVCTVGFDADRIHTIPRIIHSINQKYKIYLRYNRAMASALTLYAI